MDSGVFAAHSGGGRLALPSLRLLAPPLQLMMASMWKVLKKRDVPNYWTLAEYVSLVVDVVPDMLMHKHRLQLLLGLRARYILELCRNDLMDRDLILSHLEKIKSCPLVNVDEPGPDIVVNFVELIHSLLKDPEARQEFFTEVFPVEYGTQYDNDLQTLFYNFPTALQNSAAEVKSGNLESPVGYYYQGVWRALDGTTIQQFHTSSAVCQCLKGKMIHRYGDSTIRQWYEYLVATVPDLKDFNLHSRTQVGPFMALDYTNNIMVTYRCHGPPIRFVDMSWNF
ncbi:NXPE family member 3 [Takifugu flavidus]|uniref:NXPE family member 3 n=1 Tax=Takifugu flavidus TaxID=433684 RepID=A0A5C6MH60_9TELE|nr:NXPE family member 3 [Takifugu flavidus]